MKTNTDSLPRVKNVNKGKYRLKKHKYKLWEIVVLKWIGEREIGFVSELKMNREGFASYTIRSVSKQGCIYYDLEVDDPTDPYCYISTTLTDSITNGEKTLAAERIQSFKTRTNVVSETQPKRLSNDERSELDNQINKQKEFLDDLKTSVDDLSIMVNNLLNFSLLAADQITLEEEEIKVEQNASKNDLKKAFMKFQKNKLTNRVFLSKFIEQIA